MANPKENTSSVAMGARAFCDHALPTIHRILQDSVKPGVQAKYFVIKVNVPYSPKAKQRVKEIQQLHSQVRAAITRSNARYQAQANKHRKELQFKEGNMVWINLCKERFPSGPFGKLKPHADGPLRISKKIHNNIYQIELPGNFGVSATFNVADLSPLYDPKSFSEGRNDAGANGSKFRNKPNPVQTKEPEIYNYKNRAKSIDEAGGR